MRGLIMGRSVGAIVLALGLTLVAILGPASPVFADFSFTLPCASTCSAKLQVDAQGSPKVDKTFEDKEGHFVRHLLAGTGYSLTFTNIETGATLSLKPTGAVTKETPNSDGTLTVMSTGNNVIILFPSDVPPGPSTTLHVGRIVYTNAGGVFTVEQVSGKTIDLCAALS